MTASSCSTTTTVLPRSVRRRMMETSRSISRACRPTEDYVQDKERIDERGAEAGGEIDPHGFAADKVREVRSSVR